MLYCVDWLTSSVMFDTQNGLEKGDALSPLLFIFTLECAMRQA